MEKLRFIIVMCISFMGMMSCEHDDVSGFLSVNQTDLSISSEENQGVRIAQFDSIFKEYGLETMQSSTSNSQVPLTVEEKQELVEFCALVQKYKNLPITRNPGPDYAYEADKNGGVWIGRRTSNPPANISFLCTANWKFNTINDFHFDAQADIKTETYTTDGPVQYEMRYPMHWRQNGFMAGDRGFLSVVYITGVFYERIGSSFSEKPRCDIIVQPLSN